MGKKKHNRNRPRAEQAAATESKSRNPWLYGVHAVLAAVANPQRQFSRIVVASQSVETLEHDFNQACIDSGLERPTPEIRDRREIDALLPPGAVHQGIAALASPLPEVHIEDIVDDARNSDTAVVVVLDQATDPRNIGAVMRSAAAFGALAVVMQDRHAPETTGALAKAASGAIERLPLVRVTNLARALETLKGGEFWCAGLDGYADKTIVEAGLNGKIALVMGAEGAGLRRLTRETCDFLVKIPMTGAVESLNLANACSVALYEAFRARS